MNFFVQRISNSVVHSLRSSLPKRNANWFYQKSNQRAAYNEDYHQFTTLKEFNPKLGLEFMLESAKFKYEHAPFGLCVSLSTTKEVLDLKEAYSWCYVAEKIGNKYSKMAAERSKEILGKILLDDGVEAVTEAKELGKLTGRDIKNLLKLVKLVSDKTDIEINIEFLKMNLIKFRMKWVQKIKSESPLYILVLYKKC